MATHQKTLHKWLKAIVRHGKDSVYRDVIKKLITQWELRTDEQLLKIGREVKEFIASNRAVAAEMFGANVVAFFEQWQPAPPDKPKK